MGGQQGFGLQITGRTGRLFGRHVNIRPVGVVLAAVQHDQVKTAEGLADGLEVPAVTAVAAEKEPPLERGQGKTQPERTVAGKATAGIVARGLGMHVQSAAQRDGFIPVQFRDGRLRIAPAHERRAHAQPADHATHLAPQCRCRGIVQMIPMVVGNEQRVDVRHIRRRIDVTARKGRVAARQGRGVLAEHRVDKQTVAAQLHEIRGMSQPDNHIRVAVQGAQVGLACGQGRGRRGVHLAAQGIFDQGQGHAALGPVPGHGLQIVKNAVPILGRTLHTLQAFALGPGPERRRLHIGVAAENQKQNAEHQSRQHAPPPPFHDCSSLYAAVERLPVPEQANF